MKAPAIYDAAVFGDRTLVETLLADDPGSVNAADVYGFTPLHLAAYPDMVDLLVKHGADPNAADHVGGTVLSSACERDEPEKIELLLSFGAKRDPRCMS